MRSQLSNQVRKATQSDVAAVGEIIGDAFRDDPVMSWLVPNALIRHAAVPHYFRTVAQHQYLSHREVYLTQDVSGAALWLPPGASAEALPLIPSLGLAWRLFRASGAGGMRRAKTLLAALRANHPASPHYYLHAVGVRHDQQGRGIGSALIQHITERCDRENCIAYLENTNERNMPLYERHGFRVLREWQASGGGPSVWFMMRECPRDAEPAAREPERG